MVAGARQASLNSCGLWRRNHRRGGCASRYGFAVAGRERLRLGSRVVPVSKKSGRPDGNRTGEREGWR